MNKEQTYAHLRDLGVEFEVTEHAAVFNMEEISAVDLPYPDRDAKNLFVRDDKRRSYLLISVMGHKRVNLKEFRRAHGTRPLSFASADDLADILQLIPGAVTPLGLLNDRERRVELYLDEEFMGGIIGVHPNDNTATVWLSAKDLVRVIEDHGNVVHVVGM